ncbi:MAG: NAD(P)H-dependent oxidoreductase [Flavobacteriaceae bacterium]|nr:MAG: NAD(P)H-dependent oxidoreductase [Flavobacteriaceae bacterium]
MADSIKDLEWRYAVKKFDSEKIVSDSKIERLKEAFNLTATSYGLQPIKMVVIQNKEVQEKLIAHSYNQKQVHQASHVLVICIEKNIDGAYIANYFNRVKEVRGTSDEILDPFKNGVLNDFSKKSINEIHKWATNQAYLAMGNLLTICAIEKIDSCPMEGFIPDGYNEVLQLDKENLTAVLVLPVGFRADDDLLAELKKVRKNLNDSIIEIS